MTIPDVIVIIALGFAIVEQIQERGRLLGCWSIILICIALLWHLFPWA